MVTILATIPLCTQRCLLISDCSWWWLWPSSSWWSFSTPSCLSSPGSTPTPSPPWQSQGRSVPAASRLPIMRGATQKPCCLLSVLTAQPGYPWVSLGPDPVSNTAKGHSVSAMKQTDFDVLMNPACALTIRHRESASQWNRVLYNYHMYSWYSIVIYFLLFILLLLLLHKDNVKRVHPRCDYRHSGGVFRHRRTGRHEHGSQRRLRAVHQHPGLLQQPPQPPHLRRQDPCHQDPLPQHLLSLLKGKGRS